MRLIVLVLSILIYSTNMYSQDLLNHIHTGYQGWFTAKGDASGIDKWVHWGSGRAPLTPTTITVDMFPDFREYNSKYLYESTLTYSNGEKVKLFSSNDYATIDLHFKWMQEYGIDGVFLQRFLAPLKNPELKSHRNKVLKNVLKAAKKYDRKVAIMYDLSGYDRLEQKQQQKDFSEFIQKDWDAINKKHKLTELNCYMHENNRPVLAIWGLGFSDRDFSLRYAKEVLSLFKNTDKKDHNNTYLIAGVPSYWRTLERDSESNPEWNSIYRAFDMLSPWSVARYRDSQSHDNYIQNVTKPDIIETALHKKEYMPVVFPGFSWGNLKNEGYNSIPRNGGHFLWKQIYEAKKAGAKCLYFAMFDEVDEGTAIFKTAENQKQVAVEGTYISLDQDGYTLPSDWYLQIANEAGKVFRSEKDIEKKLPLTTN